MARSKTERAIALEIKKYSKVNNKDSAKEIENHDYYAELSKHIELGSHKK